MTTKQFYIFIEGGDDSRFFNYILNKYLYKKLNQTKIHIIMYQEKNNDKVNKYIRTFKKHPHSDYIFLSDMDSHRYNCLTSRIDKRMLEYSELEKEKVFIVKEEIESWYISGIDNSLEQFKEKDLPSNTEEFTKKEFNSMIEDVFDSRIDAMIEITKSFNCSDACDRNSSFNYFSEKMMIKSYF